MSEMIERALKALEQAEPKFGGPHTFTFSTPDTIRAERLAMVRAVIEAIREPTDAMLDAAATVDRYAEPGDEWGPMIDAALSEER